MYICIYIYIYVYVVLFALVGNICKNNDLLLLITLCVLLALKFILVYYSKYKTVVL